MSYVHFTIPEKVCTALIPLLMMILNWLKRFVNIQNEIHKDEIVFY